MNRLLRNKTIGGLLVLWVLVFSIAGASDFVICLGDNGHLAIEQTHLNQTHFNQTCSDHSCSEEGIICHKPGDCTDSSVNTFFGSLGNRRLDEVQQSVIARTGNRIVGCTDLILSKFDTSMNDDIELYSKPFSTIDFTIIIC